MTSDLDVIMEEIEELPTFESPRGFMRYGRLPYKVRYAIDMPTDSDINQEMPAKYLLTGDTGGGFSLTIWLWDEIPEEFKPVILYHELKEAEFKFADGLSRDESHKKAIPLHMAYAKKFLPEDKFQQFLEWQSLFEHYASDAFFGR
jgi:hypothetical protein